MSPGKESDEEARRIERDASPQFVRTKVGSKNSGVSSAEPRVITGDEDATFDEDPDGEGASRPPG
jgi:hypothetical protein